MKLLSWFGDSLQLSPEEKFKKDFIKSAGDGNFENIGVKNFQEIPAADYIKRFSRFSDQDASIYKIIFFEAKPDNFGFSRAVYYDAPLNIALWQEGYGVIAILGFNSDSEAVLRQFRRYHDNNFPEFECKSRVTIEPIKDACWVIQIQGVPDKIVPLQRLRWEKMLLAVAVDWARRNDFRFIHVARAIVNRWYKNTKLGEAGQKRLYLRYDVTAERMGFQPSKFQCTLDLQERP